LCRDSSARSRPNLIVCARAWPGIGPASRPPQGRAVFPFQCKRAGLHRLNRVAISQLCGGGRGSGWLAHNLMAAAFPLLSPPACDDLTSPHRPGNVLVHRLRLLHGARTRRSRSSSSSKIPASPFGWMGSTGLSGDVVGAVDPPRITGAELFVPTYLPACS